MPEAQDQVPPDTTTMIKTIAGLGHQESLIIIAFKKLQLSEGTNILDVVYSLENEESHNAQREISMQGYSAQQSLDEQNAKNPSFINDLCVKQLEEENEKLRQQTMCKVCDDRLSTELFLPCGHLACCDKCMGQLENCPFCRVGIWRTYH